MKTTTAPVPLSIKYNILRNQIPDLGIKYLPIARRLYPGSEVDPRYIVHVPTICDLSGVEAWNFYWAQDGPHWHCVTFAGPFPDHDGEESIVVFLLGEFNDIGTA